jgi:hypothetical protein
MAVVPTIRGGAGSSRHADGGIAEREEEPDEVRPLSLVYVVLPEFVVKRRWRQLLHSNVGSRLGRALRSLPGIVITGVPLHLPT